MSTKVKLKNVRLSHSDLYVAKPYKADKPTEGVAYRAGFHVLKTDAEQVKMIRDAIVAEARAQWGDKAKAMLDSFKGNAQKYCFADGDTKLTQKGDPIAPGNMVLSSRRRVDDGAPGVFDNKKGPDGKPAKLTAGSGRIYDGCYVNATVEIWAQKGENAGIRCALRGVQFFADGEAFGGSRPASADEFEAIEDDEMSSASTEAGSDDDFSDVV